MLADIYLPAVSQSWNRQLHEFDTLVLVTTFSFEQRWVETGGILGDLCTVGWWPRPTKGYL